jgi:hypothetical protein
MRQELDDALCEKYPKIFRDRHAPMTHTAMCWGFECHDGWYNIINTLCYQIQHYVDDSNDRRELLLKKNPYNIPIPDEIPQVVASQVKEKFGTLRFYTDGGDERIDGMIRMAEAMSSVTCEVCGNVGSLRNRRGWYSTCCDEHAPKD